MLHRQAVALLVIAFCVAPSLAQEDARQLIYAPEIGRAMAYETTSAGEVDALSMVVAFDAVARFSITASARDDEGRTTETVEYTDLSADLMGSPYESKYEGVARAVHRKANGQTEPESEALPAPDLLSADWLVVLTQLPFLLQFSDEPVAVGDAWSVDKQPIPSPFRLPGADGDLDSTFVSQENSLQELTDWEGRPAAVVKSALVVTLEEQQVSVDLILDGDFTADMLVTVALDTGEILEVTSELGADMIVDMSGAPVELKVAGVEAVCRQLKGE